MSKNYREKMPWYIKDSMNVIKKKTRYTFYTKLNYCESCEHTWEQDSNSQQYRYKHLPSYGAKRIMCRYCKENK